MKDDPLQHLRPVFEAELERGNRMVTTTVGPGEEGTSVVMKYELDEPALREQFELTGGHTLFRNSRGSWVVRCDHHQAALLGLAQRRSWASRRALRRWWEQWTEGPREKRTI